MKQCTQCNQIKPYSEFSKCKSFKDGLQYKCKQCRKSVDKQRYKTNKKRILATCENYRNKLGMGVYALFNIIDNVCDYVGQGRFQDRLTRHKASPFTTHTTTSTPIQVQNNIAKYGFDNVYRFEIIRHCNTKQEREEWETYYIQEKKPRYNINKMKLVD
jgi:hypothetical protein